MAATVLLTGLPGAGTASVLLSRSEALALAFPDAEVERRTFVLTDAQAEQVESLAHAPLASRLVTFFVGRQDERVVGYALIDVHPVRTLPEGLLILLSPTGEIRSLRLLAFYEPEEYGPSERWLEQFGSRSLSDVLRVGGTIHAIAGSTLTSEAVTRAARRALALHEVLLRASPNPDAAD
ncbi:MAG: FMN-binding protein [Myxococcota bacterium]